MTDSWDDEMATDKARKDMQSSIANPQAGYWNKLRKTWQDVKVKCKMMCGKGSSEDTGTTEDGDCKFTENQ